MHEEIISALKEQYSRDLRKQVVKSILGHEKSSDKEAIKSSYKIVNQIFSYVIDSLGWNISAGTNTWDTSPLKIMSEVFPKIQTTKWYKDQELRVSKPIEVKVEI